MRKLSSRNSYFKNETAVSIEKESADNDFEDSCWGFFMTDEMDDYIEETIGDYKIIEK